MNLYKLRHLDGFDREEDSIVIENGPLEPRKTTGTYKDFSQPSMRSDREAFLNYMLVINILFGRRQIQEGKLPKGRVVDMARQRGNVQIRGIMPG